MQGVGHRLESRRLLRRTGQNLTLDPADDASPGDQSRAAAHLGRPVDDVQDLSSGGEPGAGRLVERQNTLENVRATVNLHVLEKSSVKGSHVEMYGGGCKVGD